MMKVDLGQVKANIAYSVSSEGSVLRQTVQAKADKIAIHYDVTSGDSPEKSCRPDAKRPQRLLCQAVLRSARTLRRHH